jgi:CHAT domain-containing protein
MDVQRLERLLFAIRTYEPLINQIASAGSDEKRRDIFHRNPALVEDDAFIDLLHHLGPRQENPNARFTAQATLTAVFTARYRGIDAAFVEAAPPVMGKTIQRIQDQCRPAYDSTDPGVLDAALRSWDELLADPQLPASDVPIVRRERARVLIRRCSVTSSLEDAEEAIAVYAQACAQNGLDADSAYMLAVALLRRFEITGNPEDLDGSLAVLETAETLRVDGDDEKRPMLSFHGAALTRRAERTGSVADYSAAIELQRRSLLGEPDELSLALNIGNLATSLIAYYFLTGSVPHLDEAERHLDRIAGVDPAWLARRGIFVVIARLHSAQYRLTRDGSWLDRAIDTHRKAIPHLLHGSVLWGMHHNNLSIVLRDRFLAQRNLIDTEAAVAASRAAVDAMPPGFVDAPIWLETLANNIRLRAMATGSETDRREARELFERALSAAPPGSNVWRSAPGHIGLLLLEGEHDKETDTRATELLQLSLDRAIEINATTEMIASADFLARHQLNLGQWDDAAETLLKGLAAVDVQYHAQLLSDEKELALRGASALHILAVEALIRAQRFHEAIVVIERSRARILGQTLVRNRTVLERLLDPALASRYRVAAESVRALSAEANRGADVRTLLAAAIADLNNVTSALADTDAAIFLGTRTPLLSEIIVSNEAVLVYLVPMWTLGVALVLDGSETKVSVLPLPELTAENVDMQLDRYIAAYRAWTDGGAFTMWQKTLDDVTHWLWTTVMAKVIKVVPSPKVVLIPAGRLGRLPLHAAWTDDGGKRRYALDELEITYAPNARALPLLGAVRTESLLAVRYADAQMPLPLAPVETELVTALFGDVVELADDDATPGLVASHMRNATVAHFACHAYADPQQPARGGLILAGNQILSLNDAVALRVAEGTMVVLSACETGIIGDALPDEVVSLSSAMLQAGASAVISSLWSVVDASTAVLMARFYFGCRREALPPAQALRNAQQWVRDAPPPAIAEFLRANWISASARELADEIERGELGDLSHPVHWAAFTYTGA